MEPKDTKRRILDAAEHLFAVNGYRGTSLRTITAAAKANLAAVNYHFGSKQALIEAVIERRIVPLNRLRLQRLEEVRAMAHEQTTPPTARQVLAAFVEPSLAFRASAPGARDFITLIGRALAEPDDTVRNIFVGHIRPVVELLETCLAEALPHLPDQLLTWRLHFALGALSHIMNNMDKLQTPAIGLPPVASPQEMVELLLPFLTAGMEAPR